MNMLSLALETALAPSQEDAPLALPHCDYPWAVEIDRHGVQALPPVLPRVRFEPALPHRSRRHRAVPLRELSTAQVLETAAVVAESFARREPQCRHLRPPRRPAAPPETLHVDPFGTAALGPWTTQRLLYWFVRLLVLTDPTSPVGSIRLRPEALAQSLAIVDGHGRILGGAINETLPAQHEVPLRKGDPILDAVLAFTAPVLELLGARDAAAVEALARYPEFVAAHARGAVGHHFMVARSDALSKLDAFELVAGTAERYRELGFAYFLVEATNQWTGAACETLGGVRVHFAPFRTRRVVPASRGGRPGEVASRGGRPGEVASHGGRPDEVTSPDGYLAAKDSGSMLYVLRLA